jgi:hypothetical protein
MAVVEMELIPGPSRRNFRTKGVSMRLVTTSLMGMVLLSALSATANDVHQNKCKGSSGACI